MRSKNGEPKCHSGPLPLVPHLKFYPYYIKIKCYINKEAAMIELYKQGIFLVNGTDIVTDPAELAARGLAADSLIVYRLRKERCGCTCIWPW